MTTTRMDTEVDYTVVDAEALKVEVPTQWAIMAKMVEVAKGIVEKPNMRPLRVGSNGHFPYNYKNSENVFVAATWKYINRNIDLNEHGFLEFGGVLSNRYEDYITVLQYEYSKADQADRDAATIKMQETARDVVNQYESIYGKITSEQKIAAGVDTKIDYVIMYKMNLWAGTKGFNLNDDSIQDLRKALPKRPASAEQLIPVLTKYLSGLLDIKGILNAQFHANYNINRIATNTQHPSEANGGEILSDNRPHVKFNIKEDPTVIDTALADQKNSFTIKMSAKDYKSSETRIEIEGKDFGVITLADLITFSFEGSHEYSLYNLNTEGSECNIETTFAGVNAVHIEPADFYSDTGTGWFSPDIIAEAIRNQGKDVSGYKLRPYPKGTRLGWLEYLVISQFPQITIKYSNGKASNEVKKLASKNDITVSIFGIPLLTSKGSYASTSIKEHGTNQGYTISFTPPPASGGALDQRAYVIGGFASTLTAS